MREVDVERGGGGMESSSMCYLIEEINSVGLYSTSFQITQFDIPS